MTYPDCTGHTPGPWTARIVTAHGDFEGEQTYELEATDKILGVLPLGHLWKENAVWLKEGEAEANARLIAVADGPHICSDPACPGNRNRMKLEAFEELLAAATAFRGARVRVERSECVCELCGRFNRAIAAAEVAKGTDRNRRAGKRTG